MEGDWGRGAGTVCREAAFESGLEDGLKRMASAFAARDASISLFREPELVGEGRKIDSALAA